MEISFVKLSPTQNVTVLAISPVPRAEPTGIGRAKLPCDAGEIGLARVDLPGITHLVAPMDGLSREEIQRRIRQWNGEIRADALGVLRWDEAAGRMEPIVYVPETDSAVWERGCGSGTAALGAYLARRFEQTVIQ